MWKKMIPWIAIVITSFVLSGCKPSALEKLQDKEQHADMNITFWWNEHDHKTPLWDKAVRYCLKKKDNPVNCLPVQEVYALSHKDTEVKPYGTSGDNFNTVPTFR